VAFVTELGTAELVAAALEAERQFVQSLGGHTLSLAGGRLVTNERIPIPRFNFIQELNVHVERKTAFFERALDHYFQRALRPTLRAEVPVPEHLDRTLTKMGFRANKEPLRLLIARSETPPNASSSIQVRAARPEEVDQIVSFWTDEPYRAELRRGIDVLWNHPNPEEELVPMLACLDAELVSAALVYRYGRSTTIHFVSTLPVARGQGAATQLVHEVLVGARARPHQRVSIFAESSRLEGRLRSIGFEVVRRYALYELPPEAELALPPVGPTSPPRWRPPRNPPGERPAS